MEGGVDGGGGGGRGVKEFFLFTMANYLHGGRYAEEGWMGLGG